MDQKTAPYVSQDPQEVASLIRSLEEHAKKSLRAGKNPFSCRKTTFNVANSPEHLHVDSWRFQDWDYKRDDLPTYARGLFTYKTHLGTSEIAIRGYDKFFNIDEVNDTKWENIEKNTEGPYELSLKENGCIIFLSGLSDDSLLVCSKHSTGARSDTELSHAIAGEQWVDKQLQALGRTRQDLARELRKRNVTAIAELCDDSFEEHILAYENESAGLYLHGLNLNIPEFSTYPGSLVQAFAAEWGFKRTNYLVQNDISSARTFLEAVAETGSYNGRDVEGFVIRCKSRVASGSHHDWFFKYKFEEPYLMYRQWRESTKAMINGKPTRIKKHVKITEEYLLYARHRLAEDPKLGKAYNQNHGIIALRDDFLKEKNLKGSDLIRLEYATTSGTTVSVEKDIILVPIATIGCGKTTISVALQHLFGWSHVQNDNITGKGRPPRFTREVLLQLKDAPVVIADRNNAQRHERRQIIEDVQHQHATARLVALNFMHPKQSLDDIRQVTRNRVFSRGDNHQTIQAATDQNKVIGIMEGFIQRFEALNIFSKPDDGFDAVIDLDPIADSRENLETVVTQMHTLYPALIKKVPSSDELDEAISFALNEYKPEIKHNLSSRGSRVAQSQQINQNPSEPAKPRKIEYFAVFVPKTTILNALETVFAKQSTQTSKFYRQLQQTRRVQPTFHVTLIHRATAKDHPHLWERYQNMHAAIGGTEEKLGDCKIQLERVVWSERIMAIVVRILDDTWKSVNAIPHITIGTRGNEVKPKESNELLNDWLTRGSGDDSGIGEVAIKERIIVDCTAHGVLQRF